MYGRVSSPFLNKIKLFRNTQDRDYSGMHTWLSTQDLCGGFHQRVILVLLSNYSGLVWWVSPEGFICCKKKGLITKLRW
jgi:hypothetical protein